MTAAPEQFLDEKKSLACIHCGLCLGSCPTYLETGNENDSPRGRIYLMRAVQDGRTPLSDTTVRHLDLCLGCRACEAACPSGVHYGELLEATRDHVEHHHERSPFQNFLRHVVIEQVFPHPERMKLALFPARLLRRAGAEHLFPKFIRDSLALLPSEMTEGVLPEVSPAIGPRRGRVGFVRGCVMNVMFGRTNENSIHLLNRAGYDVVTPRDQGCCGALHAHGGNLAAAREAARVNLTAFGREPLDAIIINAAGCGSTLKEYGHLLAGDANAAAFSTKVKDLSEFLVSAGFQNSQFAIRNSQIKVSFHDACHLAHAQRITQPPRVLVKAVAGANYVEMPESDVCCGSAGSYNLTEPEMAERLQTRKVANILKTGANCIVTTNPGCLLQMRAGLDRAGAPHVETLHIADYLARALG
ncbi:MAG: (Fe-S)-binding protein [Proteobacteria bacterium]|nr:(Fe-S)-binding protein [Pseudomonadota bacterium]